MINIGLWYLFPLSILISTVAMMAGIGGAAMFSPVFMLLLGLDAISAFATGLFVELFGFTSGLIGYWRKKLIDFSIVRRLGIVVVPSVIAGIVLARFLPSLLLKLILAALLLYLSISFITQKKKCNPKHPSCNHETALGEYSSKMISPSVLVSSIFGGLLFGSISSGLGELNEYNFLKKLRLPLPISSGTSVFLVAISAFVGILIHASLFFVNGSSFEFSKIANILLFVLPGVILGAQAGVFTSQRVNLDHMGRFVGGLFMVLFILVIILLF